MAEKSKSEELKWGWSTPEEENAHGPFETRAEALDAAKKHLTLAMQHSGECEVKIGRCEPTGRRQVVESCVLEWINGQAYDNGFAWLDEGVFEFKNEAFRELMKKHIVSTGAWQLVDTEKVRIRS